MGAGQLLVCCRVPVQEGDYQVNSFSEEGAGGEELSPEDYSQLCSQLRQINLLTALDFQIDSLQDIKQQLLDISSCFGLIGKFIEMIEFETAHSFLNILQSKTYHFDKLPGGNHSFSTCPEICLFDYVAFKREASNSKEDVSASKEVSPSFRILNLIKLEHPMNQYESSVFFEMMISELCSIPNSQDFMWEIQSAESLKEMVFHLRYHLPKYLPFLNNYLSLNDPTSYTHIRCFYHLVEQHFCHPPPVLSTQKHSCLLTTSLAECWLYKKDAVFIASTFLVFQPQAGKAISGNLLQDSTFLDRESLISVRLSVYPSPQLKGGAKRFVHNGTLYYLPFTMFVIQKVVRSEHRVDVLLVESQQQTISKELKETFWVGDKEEPQNHVLINQNNLLTELKSLRTSLFNTLQENMASIQESHQEVSSSQIQSIFRPDHLLKQYYEHYLQHRVSFLQNKTGFDQKDSAQQPYNQELEVNASFSEPEEEELSLIELPPAELKRFEVQLEKYIQKHSLDKLQHQIMGVDSFCSLKSLNLSQSWLNKIEHLNCFPNLTELFLYSNEITKIEGLAMNKYLRVISLSKNKIVRLENLDHLIQLRECYFTKNQLEKESASYLATLRVKNLRVLSISFCDAQDSSYQALALQLPFKIRTLVINEAGQISSRTKKMLAKRLKGTEILFFDT